MGENLALPYHKTLVKGISTKRFDEFSKIGVLVKLLTKSPAVKRWGGVWEGGQSRLAQNPIANTAPPENGIQPAWPQKGVILGRVEAISYANHLIFIRLRHIKSQTGIRLQGRHLNAPHLAEHIEIGDK